MSKNTRMIKRWIIPHLEQALEHYPAVALLGPRQAGKTTLAHVIAKKHYRVHHGKNEFAKKKGRVRNHINGIENFWGLAKVRL